MMKACWETQWRCSENSQSLEGRKILKKSLRPPFCQIYDVLYFSDVLMAYKLKLTCSLRLIPL